MNDVLSYFFFISLNLNTIRVAAERKRLGNEYFSKSDYNQAFKMYSAAIEIMPTEAAYFGNRSACLLMMQKFKDAADDARVALSLDPNLKNGYVRLVRATLALGDVAACEAALSAAASKKELNIDFTDEAVVVECHSRLRPRKYPYTMQNAYYRGLLPHFAAVVRGM